MLPSKKSALSAYQQNLLSATVPVNVLLGGRKQPLGSLLAIVPGSILCLETRFGEPLRLSVGEREIGLVEAVKIGDRFGVQVREMGLPKTE